MRPACILLLSAILATGCASARKNIEPHYYQPFSNNCSAQELVLEQRIREAPLRDPGILLVQSYLQGHPDNPYSIAKPTSVYKKRTPTETIARVNNVSKIRKYLREHLLVIPQADQQLFGREVIPTFTDVHNLRVTDCLGASVAAYTLLTENGYEAYMVFVGSTDNAVNNWLHAFVAYRDPETGKLGKIGGYEADNSSASQDSIEGLLQGITLKGKPFTVYALATLCDPIPSDGNLQIAGIPESVQVASR